MFRVFAFGFETRNKTISSLVYRLINEDLLVADHISIRCHFSSWTYNVPRWFLINMFLRSGLWAPIIHGDHLSENPGKPGNVREFDSCQGFY